MDIERVCNTMIDTIAEWANPIFAAVNRALAELDARIEKIQLTAGPQGPRGETGPQGLRGEAGKDGEPGKDGASPTIDEPALIEKVWATLNSDVLVMLDAVATKLDARLTEFGGDYHTKEEVQQAIRAEVQGLPKPADGKDGRDGKDGKDADEAGLLMRLLPELREVIDVSVKAAPPPKDGVDGVNGRDGQDGRDGKDADERVLLPVLEELIDAKLNALPAPKDGADGKDGRDGADGKDASTQNVLDHLHVQLDALVVGLEAALQ